MIWRIVAAGSTYMAHAVGAGKTYSMAAAVMEQKRLGLISKAMLVVPGHCLAQASREFLQLYPAARILVADESNFTKDKRARFLARAATATWDAIIITHSAFRFIAPPPGFERGMIQRQLAMHEAIAASADGDDRTTRKRIELMKEKLTERLEALSARHDAMLTIEEIGIDQLIVDEAQEFRKLTFATNRATLKGVDPNGSQRAWDLYVKARFIDGKNPGRALIQSSGTPVTNTLGELFTLLRFQDEDALRERGVHEFDAWASTFGDTVTELELQPSGDYKPVERFANFINVPELIDMFRTVADVVLKPTCAATSSCRRSAAGNASWSPPPPAPPSSTTRRSWRSGSERSRRARASPSQATTSSSPSSPTAGTPRSTCAWPGPATTTSRDNKLNALVANVHRIWDETSGLAYVRPDGTPHPIPGAARWCSPTSGPSTSKPSEASRPTAGSSRSWSGSACRRRKWPTCRTTRSRPTSSACSTTSTRDASAC